MHCIGVYGEAQFETLHVQGTCIPYGSYYSLDLSHFFDKVQLLHIHVAVVFFMPWKLASYSF